jgi:hypothetical protein
MWRAFARILVLLVPGGLLPAGEVYLPITGSVGVFRTDTRIFNPSRSNDIVIVASFLPVGQNNTEAITRDVALPRREMVVLDDVVGSLFGASGLGAIRLRSDDAFVATSRIYAGTESGTLGQSSPGVDLNAAKANGVLLQLETSGAPGQKGTFRTNLGFVNPHPEETTVTIRTYDRSNQHFGAADIRTLPPFGVLFPLTITPAPELSDAWVAYEATNPIFAFGSVVDNGTTDPTFIAAFEDTPPGNSLVLFDEGHRGFHSISTTFAPFATLLRGDGWSVESSTGTFDAGVLSRARILVIANAIAANNVNNWTLPTPSAFSAAEIAAIRDWVASGGSLLLIADHMPFPGAAGDLAAVFDIRFSNGFAFDPAQIVLPSTCLTESQVHQFRKSDATLREHAITNGVDSVGTFTGSAFQTGSTATPLMVFGPGAVSIEPVTAWQFPSSTPRVAVSGWFQGAVLEYGEGRVGVFGEAAMFSEQTCGAGTPMGMNSPAAQHNRRFVLNVIRWLGGRM